MTDLMMPLTSADFAAAFRVVSAVEERARARRKTAQAQATLRRELETAFTAWAAGQAAS